VGAALGDLHAQGDFGHRESREEAQADDGRRALVLRSESFEGLVEREDFIGGELRGDFGSAQGDAIEVAAALVTAHLAGVIDQHASHRFGGSAVEVSPVAPSDLLVAREAHPRLVNQCRRLQRVFAALTAHAVRRETLELGVDQRQQLSPLAVAGLQDACEFAWVVRLRVVLGSHGQPQKRPRLRVAQSTRSVEGAR
jgi:hypothetical protein